jgi:hypothetical protein
MSAVRCLYLLRQKFVHREAHFGSAGGLRLITEHDCEMNFLKV